MTLNKKNVFNVIIYILIIGILVIIDQFTKVLAYNRLKDNAPFIIIKNIFELRYLENRGAAFGMLQNQKIFFVIIASVMSLVVLYILAKCPADKKYIAFKICLLLIGAGAIGNLIDRLARNFVVDFFYFILIDFPIFNVADIYVSIACVLLIILILFVYKDADFDFLKKKKVTNGEV